MKNKLKNILQKINVFILSAVLVCAMLPVRADAAYEIPGTCQIQTDSGAQNTVKTLDYSYDRNTFSCSDAISIEGIKSDHTDAATMTPAANPINIFSIFLLILFLIKNTIADPSKVPMNGIITPAATLISILIPMLYSSFFFLITICLHLLPGAKTILKLVSSNC